MVNVFELHKIRKKVVIYTILVILKEKLVNKPLSSYKRKLYFMCNLEKRIHLLRVQNHKLACNKVKQKLIKNMSKKFIKRISYCIRKICSYFLKKCFFTFWFYIFVKKSICWYSKNANSTQSFL